MDSAVTLALEGIQLVGSWVRNHELFAKEEDSFLATPCKYMRSNQLLCYRLMHLGLEKSSSYNQHNAVKLILWCNFVFRQLVIQIGS